MSQGCSSVILGGAGNHIETNVPTLSRRNSITGGHCNHICNYSNNTSIVGGCENSICWNYNSVILGGYCNILNCSSNSIISGRCNNIYNNYAGIIIGGGDNCISYCGNGSIIGSGNSILYNSGYSSILSGCNSCISYTYYSSIIAGCNNFICESDYSVIIGGENNCLYSSCNSVVIGGNSTCVINQPNTIIMNSTTNLRQIIEISDTTTTISTSPISINFTDGSIKYFGTVSNNFDVDFINVPTVPNTTIKYTLMINQGPTPYMITGLTINSSTQSIKWINSSSPSGSSDQVDIVGLMFIFNGSGSVIQTLAQISTFG